MWRSGLRRRTLHFQHGVSGSCPLASIFFYFKSLPISAGMPTVILGTFNKIELSVRKSKNNILIIPNYIKTTVAINIWPRSISSLDSNWSVRSLHFIAHE